MKRFGLAALTTLAFAGASCLGLSSATYAADMLLKAPAPEPMPVSGYVELYSGWGSINFYEDGRFVDGYDGWTLGGAGRATYWWSRGASIQLDAQAEGTSYREGSSRRNSEQSFLVGGHASWRDSRYLVGIFAAAGDATGQDLGESVSNQSYRHGLIGLEGQAYLGAFTLYGQVGYDTTIGNPIVSSIDNLNAWFARGTVRYYFTPNTRLEGTGLYAWGSEEFTGSIPNCDFNIWLVRAKLEHKFSGTPWSAFVAYEWVENRFDSNIDVVTARFENQKVTAGVRLGINEGTLQVNDTKGTTLDIIDVLKYGRLGGRID